MVKIKPLIISTALLLSSSSYALATDVPVKEPISIKQDNNLSFLQDLENNIKNFFSEESITNTKEKALESFETLVDFIFYGKEINGITFKQLPSETKKALIRFFTHYFPHFEEDMKHGYNQFVTDLQGLLNEASAYLDSEDLKYLQDLSDDIAKTWDKATDMAEKGFQKVITWFDDITQK